MSDEFLGFRTLKIYSLETVISQTKSWVEQFVIGLNLCPFAKVPFQKDLIQYSVFEGENMNSLINSFAVELDCLINMPVSTIETSILIVPNMLSDFEEYLDVLEELNVILEETELTGIIQIASFHLDYQFADSDFEDVENFTNRSPFPMFHFLREESVEKAVENYPNPESIPERNMEILRNLGIDKVQNMLSNISGKFK